MKKSLKFFPVVVLLLFAISSVSAQRGSGGGMNFSPEERAQKQTDHLTELLSLSEKQAEKVHEINLKFAEKMKAAREENAGGDRSAMRETMRQIRSEQDAELKTMLTSDQYELMLKDREEMRQRRGERRKPKKENGSNG